MRIFKNIFYLIISGLVFYGQMVQAEIVIVSGADQVIKAGAPSAQIVVKITDGAGNPEIGVQVNFSLKNPAGNADNERLVALTANTNNRGEADTIMNFSEITGIYTLSASHASNNTQIVSTEIQVVAGEASSFIVVAGDNQQISKGKFSENIVFRVTDDFSNIVKGEAIDFRLKNASGNIIDNGLTVSSDVSNENALVNTRVNNILTQEGTYTVVASLHNRPENVGRATIEIRPSLPNLPALGFGGIFQTDGIFANSTARFYGGISINGSPFEQEVVTKANNGDEIIIQGAITADENHLAENYDILVVASYKANPFSAEAEQFFVVLNSAGAVQPWTVMDTGDLQTFKENVVLLRNPLIEIFKGQFALTGLIRVFFAYRLDDGTIVFNSNLTINLLLEK